MALPLIEPQLEIIFENHIPSKKNHGRSIVRGGKTFHVPSAAHERWRKAELLSLIQGLPGCKLIAQKVDRRVVLSTNPERWVDGDINNLAKGMRRHPAVFSPPYRLEYDFYPGTLAAWDLSNAEESINDLLVDARLIQDDSWHYLRERQGRVAGFNDGAERCIVRLYCLPPGPADDALAALQSKDAIRRKARESKLSQKVVQAELRLLLDAGLRNRAQSNKGTTHG